MLRVLLDRDGMPAQFMLLGSASPELLRQTTESLAGRVEVIEVRGFTIEEVGPQQQEALWWRGGYPRSFMAANDVDSRQWRRDFMRLVVEPRSGS